MRVAALRELFEESNILLARQQNSGLFPHDVITPSLLRELRARVQKESGAFFELVERFDLVLETATLRDWAHWITPEAEKYR